MPSTLDHSSKQRTNTIQITSPGLERGRCSWGAANMIHFISGFLLVTRPVDKNYFVKKIECFPVKHDYTWQRKRTANIDLHDVPRKSVLAQAGHLRSATFMWMDSLWSKYLVLQPSNPFTPIGTVIKVFPSNVYKLRHAGVYYNKMKFSDFYVHLFWRIQGFWSDRFLSLLLF